MPLMTNTTSIVLWQDLIKHAETRCTISLSQELETYLAELLMRYSNKPELARRIFAYAYLEAMQKPPYEKQTNLQFVGDECLLYAGLFPASAEKKLIKINYFVELGRTAYHTISHTVNDIYSLLAAHFVALMDILQSIGPQHELLPIEAYERWNELGSQRAFKTLQAYSQGVPYKK